jgi:hypothetical protein
MMVEFTSQCSKKSDAKTFNKAINKHGPDAQHLATALAAATAT